MKSTILIVDDQPVFRQGLRLLLEKETDLRVVGEVDTGPMAIEIIRRHRPHLVVMGMNTQHPDGLEVTRRMLSECPDTRVVALSAASDTQIVRALMQAGVSGYILKGSNPEEIIEGIRTVLSGDTYLSPSIANLLVADYKTLISQTAHTQDRPPVPMLYTKLHRPPLAPHAVSRTRLLDVLEHGVRHPMTLIAAPAGYGKSVLASQWLDVSACPGAWVSLDEHDNDVRVFLSYVLAAIQKVFPRQRLQSQSLVKAATLPPIPVISRYLLNDLDTLPEPFILILDDVHFIHNPAIHDFIGELLVHPSPIMHLVLLTRRDPPLPLTALRSRGRLTEITTAQLRFTVSETKSFLERVLHIAITDKTAQILEDKMEGWVTGLHLAAISIRNEGDQERLTAGLLATPQYVQDYLIQEVLSQAQPQFRLYLLQTAILDRFCAPLCDALSAGDTERHQTEGDAGGRDFVDWLINTHVFVIPLDTTNRWLRYHHLFQELLKRELHQQATAREIATLHSRASAWFESRGLITESIEHALAAGDVVRAAEIIERCRYDEFTADRWYVVERWLAMLPADIKRQRPKLLLSQAWIASCRLTLTRLPRLVEQVESLLRGHTAEPTLSGELALFQGYLQYWEGQAESSRQCLEAAVSQLSGQEPYFESEAQLLLGLARCMAGQKALSVQALEDRIQGADAPEGQVLARLIGGLVFIHLVCGNLPRACVEAQRLQRVAKKNRIRNTEAWSSYMWACTHLHTGELAAASHHFAQAVEQQYVLEPMAAVDALAGLALTQQLLRLDAAAAETAGRLLEFAGELNEPSYLAVAHACRARLALLRGDLTSAVEWARSIRETPVPSQLFMWLEVPSITQARVLIADAREANVEKAIALLRAIRQQSEACRFTCQTIEVSVLETLALETLGRTDEALKVLAEAVALAEPGGWIRPFVEAGPPMADLLTRLSGQHVAVDYMQRIVAAVSDSAIPPLPSPSPGLQATSPPTLPAALSPSPQPLVEPLTHRELDVLELLSRRLQNREIAEKLFITTATVKGHLKNIYHKLDARNRREAVENARALGIWAKQ